MKKAEANLVPLPTPPCFLVGVASLSLSHVCVYVCDRQCRKQQGLLHSRLSILADAWVLAAASDRSQKVKRAATGDQHPKTLALLSVPTLPTGILVGKTLNHRHGTLIQGQ